MSNIFGSPRRFRDDDWYKKGATDRLIDDLKARTERLLDDETGSTKSDNKHSASYSTSSSSSKRETTSRVSEYSSTRKDENGCAAGGGTTTTITRSESDERRSLEKDKENSKEEQEKECFEEDTQYVVKVDVSKFPIDKVHVKVSADNTLLIDAEHEEKTGDRSVCTRTLSRKFILPTEVDTEKVTSRVDHAGLLTVYAPKKTAGNKGERIIPVKLI